MRVTERMLEDFICEYPEGFWKDIEIIGRQVRLPHGILDLLAFDHEYGWTLIIELKAREIQPNDVGQVLRYSYDIVEELLWHKEEMWARYADSPENYTDTLHDDFYRDEAHDMYSSDERAFPVLVGPSISDCAHAAAQAASVRAVLWNYKNGIFHFGNLPDEPAHYHARPNWSNVINKRIEDFARRQSEHEFEVTANELFIRRA